MNPIRDAAAPQVGITIALFAVALEHPAASAFNLRVPQVALNPGSLQGYLNAMDGGINVQTDQLDAQVWTSSISGNSTFTLMIELAGNASQNAIGIYNTNAPPNPPLFQVFPGSASAGWFATAHFSGGNMVVTLFDNNSIIQGQTFYGGVNANGFGFYLQGPGGTFYSQDARNPGGAAQALTYLGRGEVAEGAQAFSLAAGKSAIEAKVYCHCLQTGVTNVFFCYRVSNRSL